MKRFLLSIGLLAGLAGASLSAAYRDFEQITVANTAIGFTSTKITAGLGHVQAQYALCRVRTAQISYRIDGGTPTTTVGMLLNPGDILPIQGTDALLNFLAIRVSGASAQLDCIYSEERVLPQAAQGQVAIDQTTAGTTNAVSLAQVGATTVVTGGVNGSLGIGGVTANNAAPTGNPEQIAGYSWTDGTSPTATTAGNVTRLLTTTDGRLVVTSDHPKRFSCSVSNSAATILTALGGSCIAPGAGLSLYITDINFSSSAASTTTADQQFELKTGTGGTCGAATAVIWNQFGALNAPVVAQFITPIKVTANNELCWMMAAAGNKSVIVNGFIAP